jgi:hypothetical protein
MKRQSQSARALAKARHGALASISVLALLAGAGACSSKADDDSGTSGQGGSSGKGGSGATGGTAATGGTGGSGGSAGGTATGGKGGSDGKGGSSGKGSGGSGAAGTGGMGGSVGATGGDAGTSGKGGTGGKGGSGGSGGKGGSSGTSSGTSTAADAVKKLGRDTNFLFGMGNDLDNDHNKDGAYTLGVTMDIHYAYLVGLPGEGGWPDWNSGGTFVNILTDTADAHGTTPMFDVYGMAAHGEGNASVLQDTSYMSKYWSATQLLFERLAAFDKPAIVHLEPDFWGFVQQSSGGDPTSIPVLIHDYAPDCADQPEDLVGLGHCIIKLSRMISPKVLIGFHASGWAGSPPDTVTFLNALGADESDFIGIDLLDRDAGCFEAHTDEACQRNDGPWYWDESNQTSPNFHDFLDFSKTISDGLKKPVLWWQVPFGVPSDTPGGTSGHYRDNRVHYIFSHVDEFIDAGGMGVAFGVGAGNQTYITTDGDQFKNAVTAYYADPTPLP